MQEKERERGFLWIKGGPSETKKKQKKLQTALSATVTAVSALAVFRSSSPKNTQGCVCVRALSRKENIIPHTPVDFSRAFTHLLSFCVT
jgi:hypothetical protein